MSCVWKNERSNGKIHFGLQGKLCQLTCVNYKLKFNKEETFSKPMCLTERRI